MIWGLKSMAAKSGQFWTNLRISTAWTPKQTNPPELMVTPSNTWKEKEKKTKINHMRMNHPWVLKLILQKTRADYSWIYFQNSSHPYFHIFTKYTTIVHRKVGYFYHILIRLLVFENLLFILLRSKICRLAWQHLRPHIGHSWCQTWKHFPFGFLPCGAFPGLTLWMVQRWSQV